MLGEKGSQPFHAARLTSERQLKAQQLQALIYLRHGYVNEKQIDPEGKIDVVTDPHQQHSEYFAVYNQSGEVVAVARQILSHPKKQHNSFQVYNDLKLSAEAQSRIESIHHGSIVEISALAKQPHMPTIVTFLLYRAMWQHSLRSGHSLWLMACDERLFARLKSLFGNALSRAGKSQFYKGHNVIPVIVEIDASLYNLMKSASILNPFKWVIARRLVTFFTRGLSRTHIDRALKRLDSA